jgi:hypothetical protein
MTDIVEKMRKFISPEAKEAAAEIERLRLGWIECDKLALADRVAKAAENERLRTELAQTRLDLEYRMAELARKTAEATAFFEAGAAARADAAAVRELMNAYNLGGWTDAVEPMKRALRAEAELAKWEAAAPSLMVTKGNGSTVKAIRNKALEEAADLCFSLRFQHPNDGEEACNACGEAIRTLMDKK